MAYQKLQGYRALEVYKTNAIESYPDPNRLATFGTNSSVTADKLVATSGDFINNKIEAGYIIANTTDGSYAIIEAVDSATTLSLSVDIFTGTAKKYRIYSQLSKEPCLLYIGTAGVVDVDTAGGDSQIEFVNIGNATFLPVQVKRVNAASTASNFIALW
jgi:hypothetical protein